MPKFEDNSSKEKKRKYLFLSPLTKSTLFDSQFNELKNVYSHITTIILRYGALFQKVPLFPFSATSPQHPGLRQSTDLSSS